MSESISRLERRIAEEQQSFARPLRSLVRRAPVVCAPGLSVAAAAARMRAEDVGSLVVLEAGRPVGIVTERDVVAALADSGAERAVAEAMTPAPFSLPAHALAYEAAVAMIARRIRHVLVTQNNGELAGVVSERDLFSLQRLGFGEMAMEIRLAASLDVLARLAEEVRGLARLLVEQRVGTEQLMLFVSVLNDRIASRAIELVRKHHELDRVSWCWLAFGSEGRFEQTFSTDQDNGLAFAAHDGAEPDEVRRRLLPFAQQVNDALDACGYPLCKGNVMASNPKLCLTLPEWKARMAGWLEVSNPKALLDAAICFDFRALYGDASLAAELRDWLAQRMRAQPAFLRHLVEAALQSTPALGRFGAFDTEDSTINLKLRGSKVFVDAARVYALAHGLQQTNSAERLRAVASHIGVAQSELEAWICAFYFVQGLRMRVQAQQPAAGMENRLAPQTLNRLERATLKEALRLARELQNRLALDYQL